MKTVITRADDCGSSHAANHAITCAVDCGFVKNVSLLAPGAYVDEAAYLLAGHEEICFGVHLTLNSEWSRVRWGAVCAAGKVPSLLDEQGFFYQDPALFRAHTPRLEEILLEYDAQLDKLTRAGFAISYADSHMMPEQTVPGLQEVMDRWIARKGLINHKYFYHMIPDGFSFPHQSGLFARRIKSLGDGQYFLLYHPALYCSEMLLCGNEGVSGEEIARGRARETAFLCDADARRISREYALMPIRYDQAASDPPDTGKGDV